MINRNTILVNTIFSSMGTINKYEVDLQENENLKEVKEFIMLNADTNEFGEVDLFMNSLDGTRSKVCKLFEYKDFTSQNINEEFYNTFKDREVVSLYIFQCFNRVDYEVTIKK